MQQSIHETGWEKIQGKISGTYPLHQHSKHTRVDGQLQEATLINWKLCMFEGKVKYSMADVHLTI
jgi:hypothetical protein